MSRSSVVLRVDGRGPPPRTEGLRVAGRWRDFRRAGRLAVHNNGCAGVCGGDRRYLVPVPGGPAWGDRGQFLAAQRCPRVPGPGPGRAVLLQDPLPAQQVGRRGLFSDSARLRVSEAWEFFGEANGVASAEEMRARIGRYRRAPIGPGEDPVIGCLFVRDVRFFPADAIADPPPQFAPNIVQGKSYDMADPAVAGYFADVLQLTLGAAVEMDF